MLCAIDLYIHIYWDEKILNFIITGEHEWERKIEQKMEWIIGGGNSHLQFIL